MINAKKELLDFVKDKKVVDAHVTIFFEDNRLRESNSNSHNICFGEIYATASKTYEEFLNKLDFFYDNNGAMPALNLYGFITFSDGTFAHRTKNKQLERWESC